MWDSKNNNLKSRSVTKEKWEWISQSIELDQKQCFKILGVGERSQGIQCGNLENSTSNRNTVCYM